MPGTMTGASLAMSKRLAPGQRKTSRDRYSVSGIRGHVMWDAGRHDPRQPGHKSEGSARATQASRDKYTVPRILSLCRLAMSDNCHALTICVLPGTRS